MRIVHLGGAKTTTCRRQRMFVFTPRTSTLIQALSTFSSSGGVSTTRLPISLIKTVRVGGRLGSFTARGIALVAQAERLIELREIVWYGRKDIIVREQAGGTGVAETTLSIYRMYEGRLYRIFRMIEDRYDAPIGGSGTITQHRQIEFPELDPATGKFLVVHYP